MITYLHVVTHRLCMPLTGVQSSLAALLCFRVSVTVRVAVVVVMVVMVKGTLLLVLAAYEAHGAPALWLLSQISPNRKSPVRYDSCKKITSLLRWHVFRGLFYVPYQYRLPYDLYRFFSLARSVALLFLLCAPVRAVFLFSY